MSLLDKAKSLKIGVRNRRVKLTEEELQILKAYLEYEINLDQFGHALGKKSGGAAMYLVIKMMQSAFIHGQIVFSKDI